MTKSLLRAVPGTYLDAMFSGNFKLEKIDGKIFLNRDPKIFRMILQYLRNGLHPKKLDEATFEQYENELEFLGFISKKSPL